MFLLSFLLMWWFETLVDFFVLKTIKQREFFVRFFASALIVGFGYSRAAMTRELIASAPKLSVSLVQGNLEAEQKGDANYLVANLNTYRELSQKALARGVELLVWPESVQMMWAPENIKNLSFSPFDPFPGVPVPLLYGGLSARFENEGKDISRFNTAFLRESTGRVAGRYHKRILMPFGEYIPFESIFPWLRAISPQSGDFAEGDLKEPIQFLSPGKKSSVGLLICYEDIVAYPARESALAGAQFW